MVPSVLFEKLPAPTAVLREAIASSIVPVEVSAAVVATPLTNRFRVVSTAGAEYFVDAVPVVVI